MRIDPEFVLVRQIEDGVFVFRAEANEYCPSVLDVVDPAADVAVAHEKPMLTRLIEMEVDPGGVRPAMGSPEPQIQPDGHLVQDRLGRMEDRRVVGLRCSAGKSCERGQADEVLAGVVPSQDGGVGRPEVKGKLLRGWLFARSDEEAGGGDGFLEELGVFWAGDFLDVKEGS